MLRSDALSLRGRARAARLAACLLLAGVVACGDDDASPKPDGGQAGSSGVGGSGGSGGSEPPEDGGDPPKPDASEPEPDAGEPDSGEPEPDAGEPDSGEPDPDAGTPLTLGGLTVSVDPEDHELDLFGVPGHKFWMEVSEEQLMALNQGDTGYPSEDIYTPGSSSLAHFADHVLVENAATQEVADYGKVELALVGESTYRTWDEQHIPNVRIDANEFDKDTRIGTYEHMRLNNGLVGSIFREALAHRIYRALDYPALKSSHAFLGSNVWGEDVWVPMVLMEMYKRRFCRDNEELIGGSCDNMWEFAGDLGGGYYPGPGGGDSIPREWCQVSDCDNTRLAEVIHALAEAPQGEGFKEAMEDYIDWDRFHEFQCLNWILWAGDDPIHNSNNNLIIERDTDHKLIWAPYSVDITAGYPDWGYVNTPLTGGGSIAGPCQRDPECWADTIATCEDVIVRFDDLNPEEMVDDLVTTLTDLDMMRYGDDARAEELHEWYAWRQTVLMDELETYRYLPDEYGNCPDGMIQCGDGGCGTEEACEDRQCHAGYEACESTRGCYDPRNDYCPVCEDSTPYYCQYTGSCEVDEQACQAACGDGGGFYVWCEYYNQCVPYWQCPAIEEDGGVAGEGGGGVGGFAGFGMGGFPGGGVPVGGIGAMIDAEP